MPALSRDLLAVVVVVADAPLVLDEAQAEIERVRQAMCGQPLRGLHVEGGIARHHHPSGVVKASTASMPTSSIGTGRMPAHEEQDQHGGGDHQSHQADRFAHQRRQREEDDARGDPQIGRAT